MSATGPSLDLAVRAAIVAISRSAPDLAFDLALVAAAVKPSAGYIWLLDQPGFTDLVVASRPSCGELFPILRGAGWFVSAVDLGLDPDPTVIKAAPRYAVVAAREWSAGQRTIAAISARHAAVYANRDRPDWVNLILPYELELGAALGYPASGTLAFLGQALVLRTAPGDLYAYRFCALSAEPKERTLPWPCSRIPRWPCAPPFPSSISAAIAAGQHDRDSLSETPASRGGGVR